MQEEKRKRLMSLVLKIFTIMYIILSYFEYFKLFIKALKGDSL